MPLLDTLIDGALARASDHAWAAADVARELRPYLGAIRDPVERASYVRRVSGSLEIPPGALERSLRAEGGDPPSRRLESTGSRRQAEFDPALRALLGALGAYPQDTI